MTAYEWNIRGDKSSGNPPLSLLNDALGKIGGTARLGRNSLGSCLVIVIDEAARVTGRPRKEVKADLTINQIWHARFMGVPMTEIAQSLGVSVRTLHRRWKAVTQVHINPNTPYSKWP